MKASEPSPPKASTPTEPSASIEPADLQECDGASESGTQEVVCLPQAPSSHARKQEAPTAPAELDLPLPPGGTQSEPAANEAISSESDASTASAEPDQPPVISQSPSSKAEFELDAVKDVVVSKSDACVETILFDQHADEADKPKAPSHNVASERNDFKDHQVFMKEFKAQTRDEVATAIAMRKQELDTQAQELKAELMREFQAQAREEVATAIATLKQELHKQAAVVSEEWMKRQKVVSEETMSRGDVHVQGAFKDSDDWKCLVARLDFVQRRIDKLDKAKLNTETAAGKRVEDLIFALEEGVAAVKNQLVEMVGQEQALGEKVNGLSVEFQERCEKGDRQLEQTKTEIWKKAGGPPGSCLMRTLHGACLAMVAPSRSRPGTPKVAANNTTWKSLQVRMDGLVSQYEDLSARADETDTQLEQMNKEYQAKEATTRLIVQISEEVEAHKRDTTQQFADLTQELATKAELREFKVEVGEGLKTRLRDSETKASEDFQELQAHIKDTVDRLERLQNTCETKDVVASQKIEDLSSDFRNEVQRLREDSKGGLGELEQKFHKASETLADELNSRCDTLDKLIKNTASDVGTLRHQTEMKVTSLTEHMTNKFNKNMQELEEMTKGRLAALKNGIDTEISALGKDMTSTFDSKLNALETIAAEALQIAQDRLVDQMSSMTDKFDGKVQTLETKADATETNVKNLNAEMSSMTDKFDAKMQTLEAKADATDATVDRVNAEVGDLVTLRQEIPDVTKLTGNVRDLTTRVDKLVPKVRKCGEDSEDLGRRITMLANQVEAAQAAAHQAAAVAPQAAAPLPAPQMSTPPAADLATAPPAAPTSSPTGNSPQAAAAEAFVAGAARVEDDLFDAEWVQANVAEEDAAPLASACDAAVDEEWERPTSERAQQPLAASRPSAKGRAQPSRARPLARDMEPKGQPQPEPESFSPIFNHPEDPVVRAITWDIERELMSNLRSPSSERESLLKKQYMKCHPDKGIASDSAAMIWYQQWLKDNKDWYLGRSPSQ